MNVLYFNVGHVIQFQGPICLGYVSLSSSITIYKPQAVIYHGVRTSTLHTTQRVASDSYAAYAFTLIDINPQNKRECVGAVNVDGSLEPVSSTTRNTTRLE